MGRWYDQLSLEERCTIARLQAEGGSLRQIAAALHRAPSTVTREMKRNRGRNGYQATFAQEQTRARRWAGSRLDRDPDLRRAVLERLAQGWSPEQVAARLARQNGGHKRISYESIYRFIYAQIVRTKDYSWRHYLPRGKAKRGFRGRRGGSSATFIQARIPLSERPAEAADRQTPGHWEADLMLFSKYGQAVLTLHERHSRLLIAARPDSKAAAPIADLLFAIFAALPEPLRRTVTFDNGTEFARHLLLHDLGLKTFFCDPHAPWQKGGIENAIGRMRRFLPRKTDLVVLPNRRFQTLLAAYNNTPRKCLDWRTPAETFFQVLHFECESTFPLARE